ncbi:MAG: hypothetical protein WB586_26360 [Chthoniobacterales bacterium]
MNVQQQEQTRAVVDVRDPPLRALLRMAKPIGTFAGDGDFILRIRDGKVTAANTGDQGGGQN